MSNEKETLLLDSPSWQTTAMIYWNGELNKLQDFVTSSTFAPHWREFDFYWLISGHEDIKASPPPREMIEQCIKEWTSGRIRYYMIRPDRASWKERTGLGHYVRLLSMIVRENMAVDGTWKVTEDEKVLEGYFTEAFALINCMRDEWKNKGKLYGYLIDPKLGLWVQEVPFDRENIITGSKAPALASIPNITIGKAGPTNDEKDPVDVKEIKAPSPLTPQSAFEIDHKQAGLRPLQISDLPPKSTDISPQSPVGNGIQIKGRMKKEEDVISPFLDSLGEELQQRKLEELRNKLSLQPKLPKVVTAANGKRSAPTEDEGDLKRRKGNHTDSPISSKPSVGNDPTNAPKQTVKQETADDMAIYKYVPTGPRHTFSWSAGDSYRPGQDIEASIFNTPLEESPIDRKMPSTIPSRHNSLKADLFKAYDLSTLSREAQAARQVKHMQELKNGYGVSTGPMIELLKLVCPYDLRGEPCENKPCRMWKICPLFDAGRGCNVYCSLAHVLRSCRAYAPSGRCKHDLQVNPHLCAGWGHETYRRDPWARPHRYHE